MSTIDSLTVTSFSIPTQLSVTGGLYNLCAATLAIRTDYMESVGCCASNIDGAYCIDAPALIAAGYASASKSRAVHPTIPREPHVRAEPRPKLAPAPKRVLAVERASCGDWEVTFKRYELRGYAEHRETGRDVGLWFERRAGAFWLIDYDGVFDLPLSICRALVKLDVRVPAVCWPERFVPSGYDPEAALSA